MLQNGNGQQFGADCVGRFHEVAIEKVDGELDNVEFTTFNNVRDPRVAAK